MLSEVVVIKRVVGAEDPNFASRQTTESVIVVPKQHEVDAEIGVAPDRTRALYWHHFGNKSRAVKDSRWD